MVTSGFVGWQSALWMSMVGTTALVAVGLAVCAALVAVWLVRESGRGHRQAPAVPPTQTLSQQQLPLGLAPVDVKWRATLIRRRRKRLMF